MTILQSKSIYSAQATHLLPGEILHIIKRKHWFVLVGPLLTLFGIALFSSIAAALLTLLFRVNIGATLLLFFFILLTTLGLTGKIVTDWLFNFYVITSHKISETRIHPLFGDSIAEVLLNQVRCTEVDIVNNGFINQILNKGNVQITFDRPTHKEEFVLSDISNPREVGTFLSDVLIQQQRNTQGLWVKDKNDKNGYRYTDRIPRVIGGDIL